MVNQPLEYSSMYEMYLYSIAHWEKILHSGR